VDYDTLKFKNRRTGLLFSLWGMGTKFALAISVGFAFPILELLSFDPNNPSSEGKIFLVVIYALVPVVLKLITIGIIWGFPFDANRHQSVMRRLTSLQIRAHE
jgi:Na+/melibiose symporter-like transporter